jgi:hypothetical protein
MTRYRVETRVKPEEAIAQAIAFFGGDGLGLEIKEQSVCCVNFEGAGGHVQVTASAGGTRTAVDVVSREWDRDVERFVRSIA